MPDLTPPRRHRHRRDPLGAAEMLGRFRRRTPGRPGSETAAAATAWPAVVGPAIADNSVPVRRSRAGMLTVACSSAAWAHELTMRRDELVGLLAAAAPGAGVTGLRFSVADHVPAGDPPPPPPPPPAPPGADEVARGEAAAAGVEDPTVRALIARAAAAAAARQRRP